MKIIKKQHILSATAAFFLLGGSAFAASVNETISDLFDTKAYTNNDGSISFSGRWIDSEDQDAENGKITINKYGALRLKRINGYTITRMYDLSHAVGDVDLNLTYKRADGDEVLDVLLWDNDNSEWDIIAQLDPSDNNSHDFSYTISKTNHPEYFSTNAAIRFAGDDTSWQNDDDWKIGKVEFTIPYKDTDADSVSDAKDIDSDGDGILNAVEIQGNESCGYGFYQVISGVLYVYDPEHSTYIQIGEGKVKYNALGYDASTGKLYAVVKESGEDDEGTSIDDQDMIEIDRATGKIKKVGRLSHGSASGDFYDGKFYYINDDVRVWDPETGSDDLYIDTDLSSVYDIAIMKDSNDGKVYAYGIDDETLYRVNLTDKSVESHDLSSIETPIDGGELSNLWGAAFVANDNELFISNNNGYIYQITDYDTDNPKATFKYRSALTNSNDGASCRHKNMYAPDSDGDGYHDYLDLDSDDDGIPDNIEAQSTSNYTAPSGNDDDSDGLDNAYDKDNNGVSESYGLEPLDTDGDHVVDYVDSDSDNDGYTDCEEGHVDADCNNITVGGNGLASWADGDDDAYTDPNGNVNDPEDDGKLFNETGDSSEAGYREFLCGKTEFKVTEYQWRLISVPCSTGNNSINDLFGGILGTYGDDNDWVMYKQTGTTDNYEVNDSHKNTDKTMLNSDDTLEVGVSYWIIADENHTITIDKTLNGLSPTSTTDTSDVSINDDLFDKVHEFDLPANSADNVKKVMVGNPFPYRFDFSKLYFKNEATDYSAMESGNNDDYILARIYTHDSSDRSDKNVSNGGGYTVIAPQTPGLSEGQIVPMEGFFLELEKQSDEKSNKFAYPLMMQYGN
jgi:guanyl-specific ribonuclease Sa